MQCDVCGAADWTPSFESPDRMAGLKTPEYALMRCRQCGFLKLDVPRDPELIATFYPPSSYYSYSKKRRGLEIKAVLYRRLFGLRRYRPLAALLFPLTQFMRSLPVRPPGSQKLFDVGCGSGQFLDLAASLGFETHGLEIDPAAVELATQKGHRVIQGFFESAALPAGAFDVVTANHVLEHALDPVAFLGQIAALLEPGGVAYVTMPNPDSWWARLFGRYWAQLDTPRHLVLIGPSAMQALSQKAGLEITGRRDLGSEFGFTMSILYWLEERWGRRFSDRTRRSLLQLSRIVLLPLVSLANATRHSDSVEYELHRTETAAGPIEA